MSENIVRSLARQVRNKALNLLLKAALEVKTVGTFRRQLWSATLALWRSGDAGPFLDDFIEVIRNQLTLAWNEGARDVGVDPREMTDDDLRELDATIRSEYEYIIGLAEDIMDFRYEGHTDREFHDRFSARIDLWVNRYTDTVNRARRWFDGKQRLMWHLGSTEEHCRTCVELDGIVAFAEEWDQAMLHPQAPKNDLLECQGWHCGCTLDPTESRRSAKALDRLIKIALRRDGVK